MTTTEVETTTTMTGKPTEYVVLRRDDYGDGSTGGEKLAWTLVGYIDGFVPAANADAAIRKAANDEEGTYVAVPARSWQPRTVKVETQRKVSLS